ncbi:diacylglycerol kinase family protein [Alteromonas flava]|uniref:diacylglycerol kinase family protein n=1 Tax=Alteromonas flava TaxID=2048003 RepID=UPI000C285C95|nr:diacylglycerol kinase family protein [Alteromonas flava]
MKMIKYYALLSAVFLWAAYRVDNLYVAVPLLWCGVSLSVVTFAYIFAIPSIFRKRENGQIPLVTRWLFYPFLLGANLYNSVARKRDKVPALQQITDNVYLACRLFPSDIGTLKNEGITAILDVTAEFDGLDWSSENAKLRYLNIPVLDHLAPNDDQLLQAINWINTEVKTKGKVVVHCALGRGRSVFVTAAYMLSQDPALTLEDAMQQIQSTRSTARLNKNQKKALEKVRRAGRLKLTQQAAIIANPVSGGGKWPEAQDEIKDRLSEQYELTVYETREDCSAKQLAETALAKNFDLIIACGGDGTLAEVADVLAGSKQTMGIIPLGTANALSMVLLGSSSKVAPVARACEAILDGKTQRIDTGKCNQRRFLLVCGIGVEASMIKQADRAEKDEKGQGAYLQYFASAMLDATPIALSIALDDGAPRKILSKSLIIANAAPPSTVLAQGGGNPNVVDGVLDVNWFKHPSTLTADLDSLMKLTVSGLLDGQFSDAIEFHQSKKVLIEAEQPIDYVLDGEVYQDNRLVIECEPHSLSIICDSTRAASTSKNKE